MYLDDYEDEIIALIKTQFHKDNYNRLYPMYAKYYNLFKKIVNLKSVLYKQEAERQWINRAGKEDDNYAEILKNSNINSIMPLCNKMTNALNSSFVRVIGYGDQDKIKYEVVTSDNVDVIQDEEDPSRIVALLHRVVVTDTNITTEDNTTVRVNLSDDRVVDKYFYWDLDTYAVLDQNKNIVTEIDNPYRDKDNNGVIPYAYFKSFEPISGDLWTITKDSDLYDGTLQVNVFQTYLNNLIKTAGYRTPYLTGLTENEAAKLNNKTNDPLQPIVLSEADSKIGTFDLSGRILEVKDVIHDIISEISDNHGVDFSSRTSSAQKMSGLALSISQDVIDNIREEQIPLYRDSEQELAEKTVIVANAELNASIDIEGDLSINFYEEQEEEDPKEKRENYKWLLSKNLISIVDVYNEFDPDCQSTGDAIKRIEENKKINEQFQSEAINFFPTENGESVDGETESEDLEDGNDEIEETDR